MYRFQKLLEYLKTRFSTGAFSSYPIKLPNTIEEFHQQYELKHLIVNLRHREPILEVKDVVKVNSNVVYNVIHSSLCTTEDKASWGFHLFNIYQQYPDSLVRSALAKMKSDMMIAQRKRALLRYNKFWSKKNLIWSIFWSKNSDKKNFLLFQLQYNEIVFF